MKIQHPPTDAQLETIRLAKQSQGLRSVDLARKANISPATLSALEGGYGNSRPAFESVCAVLGLEVEK